jgi:HK97 family phage major capsid protein
VSISTAAELKTLKDELAKQREIMDGAVNSARMEEKGVFVDGARAASFRDALAKANEIVTEIKALEGYGEVSTFMDAPQGTPTAVGGGQLWTPQQQVKSLGQMFVESQDFKDFASGGGLTMKQAWEAEIADLGRMGIEKKDVYTVSGPAQSTRGLGTTQFDPIVPREYRRARVRDLFPVSPTSANLIDFFRVIGFGANRLDVASAAATVAERTGDNLAFGVKPHSNLTFESDQAPVRTIAHWEAAHRNIIRDEPQLRATIDNELLYGIRLEEDDQILNGSGTGEDLRGIFNTPNIQTYSQATVPTDTKLDALRRAATRVMLAYYESTGFVLHPYDWESIELTKDDNGQYVLATNVAIGATQRVWRQPVVDTPACPQGTFLTGAFGLGAQLYDREQASVRIAEQHADFFIRNAVVILAEERLALAVKRPEAFVKGTFA